MVATLADPREFVARYNEAAANENAERGGHLPMFSAEILKSSGHGVISALATLMLQPSSLPI
jgi:hypothetical protein